MSCNEDVTRQIGTDMKGVLGVVAFESGAQLDEVSTYEVGKRQVKNISLKAYAEEVSGVALKVTFGTDAALVDAYNAANGTNYEILPGEAFSFGESDVLMPRFNVYSAESKLTLIGQGCEEDVFYLLPVTLAKVVGTENYEISETTGVIYFLMKVLPSSKGTGTKADPFLITELSDITTMNEKLIPGEQIYFKMEADIDMTPVTSWAALNTAAPYDKAVYFDGNGHTISNFTAEGGSYTSFFGIVNGTVENVTFDNASISSTTAGAGVVGGYAGTTDVEAHIKNVKILNSTVINTGQHAGALCGRTTDSVIENVYVENCTVSSARYAGFIASCDAKPGKKPGATIKNCYVKGGSVTAAQQTGGIVGMFEHESSVINCGVSGDVLGNFGIGGIMGRAHGAGKLTTVENCFFWGKKIWCSALTPGDNTHYSSGGIVGTAIASAAPFTFKNCIRRADIEFQDYTDINPALVDSSDIENGATTADAANNAYNYPWNGRTSTAANASAAAKELGWDETIWDLSGDEPKLK